MKTILKLKEIKKLDLGTDLAVVELSLGKHQFIIESTGLSFKLVGMYSAQELFAITDWLKDISKNNIKKEYPTTNQSEVVSFAKDMIKTNKKLKTPFSLS